MPRNLFGKTSPHDSKSLIPLSRTTAFSLIANLSGDIAVTWELRIDTLPPAYPQGNGQAETVNKVIVNGLKKRLDDAKGKWMEAATCPLDIPNHA